MSATTRQRALESRNRYFGGLLFALATLVVVHILPKGDTPRHSWRLMLAITFFGAILALLLQLLKPREEYLENFYRWKLEDCPRSLRDSWRNYVHSLNSYVRKFVWLALIFFGSTAYFVISRWFPVFGVGEGVNRLIWWASAIALLLYPFAAWFLMEEAVQGRRQLFRDLALLQDFQPRAAIELHLPRAAKDALPQFAIDPQSQSFRAGQSEWGWPDIQKNVVVFGQIGSGKTSCVLNSILEGVLGSTANGPLPPAALILDPKGDFADKLPELCDRYGRGDDLLVLSGDSQHASAGGSLRWNPFDSADSELEIASRIVDASEALGLRTDESFFLDGARKFIRHALRLIRSTGAESPPSVRRVVRLASNPNEITQLTDRFGAALSQADEDTLYYFAHEWMSYEPATRTSIQGYVTNMLDPFLSPDHARLFDGPSTMRIGEMIDQGKILYVHMPLESNRYLARLVGAFIKLEYFQEVLRRVDKQRPSFFFCDEFQSFLTEEKAGSGDSDFFERCRQSNHGNILATHSIPALTKQLQKERSGAVENLLGHLATKIFLRNSDERTNEYASNLFGERLETMGSFGGGGSAGVWRMKMGSVQSVQGGQRQAVRTLPPEEFTRLQVPSNESACCESIVHFMCRSGVSVMKPKRRWPLHLIDSSAPEAAGKLEGDSLAELSPAPYPSTDSLESSFDQSTHFSS